MLPNLLLSLGNDTVSERNLREECRSGTSAKTELYMVSLLWDQLVLFPSCFLLSFDEPPRCHPLQGLGL
jgi:hypothetical protein